MSKQTIPLISTIINVYNGIPFIEESIKSVLTQDYPNIENLLYPHN